MGSRSNSAHLDALKIGVGSHPSSRKLTPRNSQGRVVQEREAVVPALTVWAEFLNNMPNGKWGVGLARAWCHQVINSLTGNFDPCTCRI